MALNSKGTLLKISREVLAKMTNNNPQAIKAMEGLQSQAFDAIPKDIADIIERAAADAMQATMIANQMREQFKPYLQAVSAPQGQTSYLQSVNNTCECNQQLSVIQGSI